MYNPMIMQASCTIFSLVEFCEGENESDLRPIIFPISTPLVSADTDDVLMAMSQGGNAGTLMLGSLAGGIDTLVDVTQLLATMEKALISSDDDTCGTAAAEADGTNASQQSGILGPPPLMSCKPYMQASLRNPSQFAFNHVLASLMQAQLIEILTMPAIDEPVPSEARLPMSSLGGVVSLFDLPLVRPLIARSSLKSTSTASYKTGTQLFFPSSAPFAATGDGILGRPPVSVYRFQAPQKNAAVPVAPGGNIAPLQGPRIRPLMGRNFVGAGDWPRGRGGSRPVMINQGGEPKQWSCGSKARGSSKPGAGWQSDTETDDNVYEGHQQDSGPEHGNSGPKTVDADWNSYSGQPSMKQKLTGRNPVGVPQRPPVRPLVGQVSLPNARAKPPQVC